MRLRSNGQLPVEHLLPQCTSPGSASILIIAVATYIFDWVFALGKHHILGGCLIAEQAVLFSVEDGVATVSLNRPERFNAMTDELMRGISDAIDRCVKISRYVLWFSWSRLLCRG